MSSKYSIKELAIGHSFPLKLRFMIDRTRPPQTATLQQLTTSFFKRVNSQQNTRYSNEKENQNQPKKHNQFRHHPRPMTKRLSSHTHTHLPLKKHQSTERLLLQIVHLGNDASYLRESTYGRQSGFKPYRLQQHYKKHTQTEGSPRNQGDEVRSPKFSRKDRRHVKGKNDSWRVEKWDTQHEGAGCSFLMKMGKKQ